MRSRDEEKQHLYLIIAVLVVGLGVLGFYLYQEQHKSGIEVEINDDGLSVVTH